MKYRLSSTKMLLIAAGFTALFPVTSYAEKECTCRFKEMSVPEGITVCLNLPTGNVLATCSRVLNNTSWKFLEQECPLGSLEKPSTSTPARLS